MGVHGGRELMDGGWVEKRDLELKGGRRRRREGRGYIFRLAL